jgi:putative transposase
LQRRIRRGQARAGELEERLPEPSLGHQDRHDRPGRPEAALGGGYFPGWLIEPRAEPNRLWWPWSSNAAWKGLHPARRRRGQVDEDHRHLQVQVSELAKSLDETVAAFRNRTLDSGPYAHVWEDTLTQGQGGWPDRERSRHRGHRGERNGHREILGVNLITTEDGAVWNAFLLGPVARGLFGVVPVVSDAHQGPVDAIASVLPGAIWQGCRVHFVRNVHAKVPNTAQSMIGAPIRSIFEQPDVEQVHAQHARVVEQLAERFPDAAAMLVEAQADILAFASFPKEHWRQPWSNNPQERLNQEIRRRTDVVGIFPPTEQPSSDWSWPYAEQHDLWAVARRYVGTEALAKARLRVMEGTSEGVALPELADVS